MKIRKKNPKKTTNVYQKVIQNYLKTKQKPEKIRKNKRNEKVRTQRKISRVKIN